MLIDTHCHLHDRQFFSAKQAESALSRAAAVAVAKIICVGTSHQDSLAAAEFAENHSFAKSHSSGPRVFWTYGWHPEIAAQNPELIKTAYNLGRQTLKTALQPQNSAKMLSETLARTAILPAPVAIGEVGLDYHYDSEVADVAANHAHQRALLEQMLQLASDFNLPVSFHIREAFADFWGILANFPHLRGVAHSFSDTKTVLTQVLEHDLFVGVNGITTFSKDLPLPPLEKMLLETDAPFLTPKPFRGKINEPARIKEIAEFIATKLGDCRGDTARQTTQNARKLYHI